MSVVTSTLKLGLRVSCVVGVAFCVAKLQIFCMTNVAEDVSHMVDRQAMASAKTWAMEALRHNVPSITVASTPLMLGMAYQASRLPAIAGL